MLFDLIKNFKGFSIEKRILLILGFSGFAFSIITTLMNSLLNLDRLILIPTLVSGILAYLVLFFLHKYEDHKLASYFGILSLNLVLYPALWVLNSGSMGPTALFMMFNAILIAVVMNKYRYRLFLVLQLVIFAVFLLFEFYYPSHIFSYSNAFVRLLDIGFSFALVFVLSLGVVIRIMGEYNKTITIQEKLYKTLVDTNAKLKVASETDEMTGIYNRRFIMNYIEAWIGERHVGDEKSLLMVDIDYFKKINDTFGHSFGDKVLKEICLTITQFLTEDECIGRIGGEEFLMLLNGTDVEVLNKANSIRVAISEIIWEYPQFQVTISCGLYRLDGSVSLDAALEKVDSRLYEAKALGRNQVAYFKGEEVLKKD